MSTRYDDWEISDEERRKAEEKARKKAEVRARLDEAIRREHKGKKGFMTPERKKKLKALLKKITKEKLNQEQERKNQERRKIIAERTGQKKPVEFLAEDELRKLCKEFHKRIANLEDKKYDLEYQVRQKDLMVNELSIQVNDLKGKFVKPMLKKVSKYDQKLEKMAKVAAKSEKDFRNNLKRVQSLKYTIGDEKQTRPDWAEKKKKRDPAKSEAESEPGPEPEAEDVEEYEEEEDED